MHIAKNTWVQPHKAATMHCVGQHQTLAHKQHTRYTNTRCPQHAHMPATTSTTASRAACRHGDTPPLVPTSATCVQPKPCSAASRACQHAYVLQPGQSKSTPASRGCTNRLPAACVEHMQCTHTENMWHSTTNTAAAKQPSSAIQHHNRCFQRQHKRNTHNAFRPPMAGW
jgi:hypothetical protein